MVCDIVVEMKEKKQGEGITVWGVAELYVGWPGKVLQKKRHLNNG